MHKTMMLAGAVAVLLTGARLAKADEWSAYGRDLQGTRFSPLTQVTPANVAKLEPAWTFHTGDISTGKVKGGGPRSGFETTPLMMDGRLYLTTPFNRVIALDPATGKQLWAYDPKLDRAEPYGDGLINRGLAAWRDVKAGKGPCALRLYEATLDARLVSVDAATGLPCPGFGEHGQISLRDVARYTPGQYHMTSPPVVVDGVVVVGSAIDDNARAAMPDGAVRGYDARSGKLIWTWEPLQKPKGLTDKQWNTGAGNAWSVLSADPKRHLVYVPTGSASPDYWGGLRPGDNRWANSVVALDARTGKLSWGFQLVHHDLWDYDTAAAPLATTVKLKGKMTPAVIAGNKTGMVYVLDPATGKPVLPVEERPVPQSTLYGEKSSPTQPIPTATPPLVPQSLKAADVWAVSDADRKWCADQIDALSGGSSMFSPPSEAGILAIPGNVGGINWSGFAWDGRHGHLIVSVTNLPAKVRMIPATKYVKGDKGDLRAETTMQMGTPFAMSRAPLLAPSGLPCIKPPFGELMAVDLDAGKIVWRTPLGALEELAPGVGKIAKGSVVLGGPIVTAGGLIFQGGTMDRTLRAFSAETGKELWSAELPASAHATPMTYEVGGKQYVVIAAGGSAKVDEERQGDAVVAFALP